MKVIFILAFFSQGHMYVINKYDTLEQCTAAQSRAADTAPRNMLCIGQRVRHP